MFNKKQKELLRLILGNEFYNSSEYAREYIEIAKILELDESFIQELEKDFESENRSDE